MASCGRAGSAGVREVDRLSRTIRGSHITMSGKMQINMIMSSNDTTNGAAPFSTSESVPRPRMPWMTNRLMPNGGDIIAV